MYKTCIKTLEKEALHLIVNYWAGIAALDCFAKLSKVWLLQFSVYEPATMNKWPLCI